MIQPSYLLVFTQRIWEFMSTQKACTQLFIATLFIIFQIWMQPKYFSIGKWISKLWHFQTMEYYSALKINELSDHEMTW